MMLQQYQLSVYEGSYAPHISVLGVEALGLEPVCHTLHQRHLLAPGVRRIPVRQGRVRGVMYIPSGTLKDNYMHMQYLVVFYR